jgi:hypothetical protein
MINNPNSGTLCINNLNHINRLYEMMKEALAQENSLAQGNLFSTTTGPKPSIIFATTNSQRHLYDSTVNRNKLFITSKGKKIFHIYKEPHQTNRRKSVQIVYNLEDASEEAPYQHYEDSENYEKEEYAGNKPEEYYEEGEEDYEEPAEEDHKQEEANEDYFGGNYIRNYFNG